MACARVAPDLFLHLNIFLVVFAGAALAAGARLRWDPTLYAAARELFPLEYRLAAALLPAGGAALLLLAHLAAVALRTRRPAPRRALLLLYAALCALAVCGEAALAGWAAARAAHWARSPAAAELRRALHLRDHLRPLLADLAHWHPLPSRLHDILQEAEADAPRNVQVALAAALLLLVLQALAALLALLLAAAARAPRQSRHTPTHARETHSSSSDSEKAPLRAIYQNGRLVLV